MSIVIAYFLIGAIMAIGMSIDRADSVASRWAFKAYFLAAVLAVVTIFWPGLLSSDNFQ
jgi:hypothetical protein